MTAYDTGCNSSYGPRMHPSDGRVVSNFIVQALYGRDLTIFGDGLQTRSFCYVDDLFQGLISHMQLEGIATGPINLGNPSEITILELAESIRELNGTKSKIVKKPLPSDDPVRRKPSIEKAQQALGWEPVCDLRKGLTNTIEYFEGILKSLPDQSAQRITQNNIKSTKA